MTGDRAASPAPHLRSVPASPAVGAPRALDAVAAGDTSKTHEPMAAPEAMSAVHVGLYVSALRCVLTYVVAPVLGAVGIVLGPVGVLLQVLGAVTSAAGARRLWQLRHPARLPYAGLATLVAVIAAYSLVSLVLGVAR